MLESFCVSALYKVIIELDEIQLNIL